MKTKLPFLYLLLLFILGSCHTETEDFISKYCPGSCTVIKGRLTTDNNSKPLVGVTLEVNWLNSGTFGITGTSRKKAVTKTDANGNYELRFLLRDDELTDGLFYVNTHLSREKHLFCGNLTELEVYYNLKRDTTIALNYNLQKAAFINMEVLNTEAMQPEDRFYSEFIYDGSCSPTLIWQFNFTKQRVTVAANQQVTIRTYKRKAGIETITDEVVTLKPGQTINYQVTF